MSIVDVKKVTVNASPFHTGEQIAQRRAGVNESIGSFASQAIRTFMPDQHRTFFSQLPFMVVSMRDSQGQPWATLLTGTPGFVSSPDPGNLNLNALPLAGDALEHCFVPQAKIGLLGIELETRRRNRINGILSRNDDGLKISVEQSFGNCPQYISKRFWKHDQSNAGQAKVTRHTQLTEMMRTWISGADTLFIASGYSDEHSGHDDMDVSHRGGTQGFVKVVSGKRLVMPDYAGNKFFNTIGNLMVDPRVGLLFVDFSNGSLLQITGRAEIDWDSDELDEFVGAQRLINIEIDAIVQLDKALPIRWSEPENPARELRIINKTAESKDVTSFEFAPRDGGRLPVFKAGQYLPIELKMNTEESVERTYSLSNAPDHGHYRISVKRESQGLVSRYLHDQLSVGDIIISKVPEGDFVLKQSSKPVVLVSAGIGITPMVSMLHSLKNTDTDVYFIHGARNSQLNPLVDEVRNVVSNHPKLQLKYIFSQPLVTDIQGKDFDQRGRIDVGVIEQMLPGLDAQFYLCGPKSFLLELEAQLSQRGVAQAQINTESF